jgi:hypothetical protein
MKSGVLKSGSPRLSPMMSLPSALNYLALAAIAKVAEVAIFVTRVDSLVISNSRNEWLIYALS